MNEPAIEKHSTQFRSMSPEHVDYRNDLEHVPI
jgi:hypothetical protein